MFFKKKKKCSRHIFKISAMSILVVWKKELLPDLHEGGYTQMGSYVILKYAWDIKANGYFIEIQLKSCSLISTFSQHCVRITCVFLNMCHIISTLQNILYNSECLQVRGRERVSSWERSCVAATNFTKTLQELLIRWSCKNSRSSL